MTTANDAPGPAASAVLLMMQSLPRRDLCRCMAVCQEWRKLASSPGLQKHLDLAGEDITPHLMSYLGNSPSLAGVESVSFQFSTGLLDAHLGVLSRIPLLRDVNLNACQKVGDEGIKILAAGCPGIKRVSLYWNLRVTDDSLVSLATYCSGLTDLNISGCKSVSGDGVKVVTECLGAGILHLDLTRVPLLRDDGVAAAVDNCPSLESLILYADAALTDSSISRVGALQSLEKIDVCGINNLTDASIKAMAACPRLKYANLTWCIQVTDEGVVSLGEGCPDLEWLSLYGILGISDRSVDALAAGCPHMHTLDVNGCANIEGRAPSALQQKMPLLRCFVTHS